ncbi:MAG: HigA family addiction module antidote protein [Alphaproteobacteria bacterium]|nr:HigA family addiction module antidote protein [Alphaproteobacteria bacterium]
MAKKLKPMHPGEVLREEFLVPLKLSAGALAKACGLPRTRIERLANATRDLRKVLDRIETVNKAA